MKITKTSRHRNVFSEVATLEITDSASSALLGKNTSHSYVIHFSEEDMKKVPDLVRMGIKQGKLDMTLVALALAMLDEQQVEGFLERFKRIIPRHIAARYFKTFKD